MKSYGDFLRRFPDQRILVVGDIILDRYLQGVVTRISPEAPVPVVRQDQAFYMPGGAANVAFNLAAMGAEVHQVGRIGNDFEGQLLKRQLKKRGIHIQGVFVDTNVPTVTKTRVIAQRQQVVRIDNERILPLPEDLFSKTETFIRSHWEEFDAVIISDYGKGMIESPMINLLRTLAKGSGTILTVDPKVEHFSLYKEVTAITPNISETQNAIRNIKLRDTTAGDLGIDDDRLDSDEKIEEAGHRLREYLNLECLLITLGEKGMKLFCADRPPVAIPTLAQEVFDVTGAGDAVISAFTMALSCGADKEQAAKISNIAGGIVVGRMGAVAVTRDELQAAIIKMEAGES